MFDAKIRPLIDPPLNAAGRQLARAGFLANHITFSGLFLGCIAAILIACGAFWCALVAIILSRLCDGLDGAVARASQTTDFGGYLDIVCDFAFYGLIPAAFILYAPEQNGAAGGALLLAFYINGACFLGYAVLAERHDMETRAQGVKSLYYSSGLLEGSETIVFFVILCLLPQFFAPLAWVFAALCLLTTILRLWGAWTVFQIEKDTP